MDSTAQLLEVGSHVLTVPFLNDSIDTRRDLRLKALKRPGAISPRRDGEAVALGTK